MRDEWISRSVAPGYGNLSTNTNSSDSSDKNHTSAIARTSSDGYIADSRPASQGLTRTLASGLDRGATLNLAARAMKLKIKTKGLDGRLRQREVSERRQVGDAEGIVNPQGIDGSGGGEGKTPWWKNVTMEEGT